MNELSLKDIVFIKIGEAWFSHYPLSFSEEGIKGGNPFLLNPEIFIPLSSIDKLLSMAFDSGLECFQLIHHDPSITDEIYFNTVDPIPWYEAFEKKGISTEDDIGVRYRKAGFFLKMRRKFILLPPSIKIPIWGAIILLTVLAVVVFDKLISR